jgi:hypothetical protein
MQKQIIGAHPMNETFEVAGEEPRLLCTASQVVL